MDDLSPAAQEVIRATQVAYDSATEYREAALITAGIRAACRCLRWSLEEPLDPFERGFRDGLLFANDEILAIATELEAQP